MKKCSKCGKFKDLSEFGKRNRNKDGLEFRCKQCDWDYDNSRREKDNEFARKRYKENREFYIAKSSKTQYKRRGTVLPEKYITVLEENKKEHPHHDYQFTLNRLKDYKRSIAPIMREKYKKWANTDNGKVLNRLKGQRRRSKIKNLPNTLTKDNVEYIFSIQNGRCADCGSKFSGKLNYEIDHVVPVVHNGETSLDNIQLLCRGCNASKGIKSTRFIPKITSLLQWT